MKTVLTLSLLAFAGFAVADEVIVTPNTPGGDSYTNPVPGDATYLVGTSGWIYNNVRTTGTIGINSTYAPAGQNGSVFLSTTSGTGKADIENYQNFGLLSNLTSLSYDYYRDATSTNSGPQVPSLRLYVQSADRTQSGYLVFEPVYNDLTGPGGNLNAPTNTWVHEDVFAMNAKMWSTGSLVPKTQFDPNNSPLLRDWMASSANYSVLGISSGVGSGWSGTFTGAVDNLSIGFGGSSRTYNFETAAVQATPEPGTIALATAGIGLAIRRRRNAKR